MDAQNVRVKVTNLDPRVVFQLLGGIYLVQIEIDGRLKFFIQGISELKNQIISLLGQRIREIYYVPL